MFANTIGLKSCFATFVMAILSVIASGSIAQAADTAARDDAIIKQQAQARKMVQEVLNHWNLTTWNELLADDVTLSIRLGTATKDSAGEPALLGLKIEYKGRDAAKKALAKSMAIFIKSFKSQQKSPARLKSCCWANWW